MWEIEALLRARATEVQILDGNVIVGSWNIEGMTDIKLHEVCMYMIYNSVDIMCIQEVRRLRSDAFKNDAGFLVYASGSSKLQARENGMVLGS